MTNEFNMETVPRAPTTVSITVDLMFQRCFCLSTQIPVSIQPFVFFYFNGLLGRQNPLDNKILFLLIDWHLTLYTIKRNKEITFLTLSYIVLYYF